MEDRHTRVGTKTTLHSSVRSTARIMVQRRKSEGRKADWGMGECWGAFLYRRACWQILPHQVLQESTVTPLTKVMLMIHYLTTGVVRWLSGYKIQSLENAKLYGTFYFLILCYHKYVGLIYILRNLWNIYVFLTFKNYFWLFILLNVPESLFGLDKHIFMINDGKKDDFPPQ